MMVCIDLKDTKQQLLYNDIDQILIVKTEFNKSNVVLIRGVCSKILAVGTEYIERLSIRKSEEQ